MPETGERAGPETHLPIMPLTALNRFGTAFRAAHALIKSLTPLTLPIAGKGAIAD
ncbi:MAG: hypothetical protein ACFB8W_06165 [Elainellaceae cyanobacterium]